MPDRALIRAETQVTQRGVAHRDNRGAETRFAGAGDTPKGAEHALFDVLRSAFARIRGELRLQAEELELETMTRLRETRRLQPTGMRNSRLGMRVRDPRRPGGHFTLEWYRVRWRGRTDYIARGAGDRYGRKAFLGALAWERAIALEAERPLSAIRRQLRLMSEIERRLTALESLRGETRTATTGQSAGVDNAGPDAGGGA